MEREPEHLLSSERKTGMRGKPKPHNPSLTSSPPFLFIRYYVF
jgi:hypothetical protein